MGKSKKQLRKKIKELKRENALLESILDDVYVRHERELSVQGTFAKEFQNMVERVQDVVSEDAIQRVFNRAHFGPKE